MSHQAVVQQADSKADAKAQAGPGEAYPDIAPGALQRSLAAPGSLSPRAVMALQHSAGNRAVQRLLPGKPPAVQRALTVGPVNDRYEQEADRIAGEVAQRSVAQPAPVVGAEGGALDGDTSQEIRRARGGGRPIADTVRAPLESTLGSDLSHARLHTGPRADRLNDQLGARAFTVGSDIFMKRNEANLGSSKGKHLLYHELTHVQQQTGGLNRSPKPDTIQRAWALVRTPTWSRVPGVPLTNLDAKQKVKKVAGGAKDRKYPKMYRTLIVDDDNQHIKDKDGNIVWYRLRHGDKGDTYLPASSLLTGIGPTGNESSSPDMGGEDVESIIGSIGDAPALLDDHMVEGQQWYSKKEDSEKAKGNDGLSKEDQAKSDTLNHAEAGMWMSGSVLGTVSGIMGMASALKDLRDNEKGTWEKVDAVFEYFSSGMDTIGGLYGTAGAIAGSVNLHAEEGSKVASNSEAVAGWGFGFQAMFGVLSNGIKTIKSIADLIHMIYEEKTGKAAHDRNEYLSTISDLLTGALDTVRGVLVSIRQITQVVTEGIMEVFDNIIPGLDIAVAAVDTIFKGYYLVESAVHHWWMRTRKKELMGELQKAGHGKDEVKEAQKFYAKSEATKSNVGNQRAKNTKSINKLDQKSLKTKDFDKKVAFTEKKGNLRQESETLNTKESQAEQDMLDYEQGHVTRKDIAELELVSELKDANRKRIVRQSLHIASNALKIAGSITALVAGPGAPAGIGLKAAAAGIDVGMPILRSLKQWGRNKAAQKQSKGETGRSAKFFTKIFNADKSTAAKLTHRKKQAVKILLFVADLNKHIPIKKDPLKRKALAADIRIAERYIRAAGVSPRVLYMANGNPGQQIKILVEALSKRELS